jgi:RimJ/RimL family protein N-acetyltransferase
MTDPVLETERLIMRPHGLEDFPDSLAMWSDPQIARSIGGRSPAAEEVWRRLMSCAGSWALLGFGYWVVREREGGRFVGEVGFGDSRRGLGPAFDGAPEIGWTLAPAFQGRGLAGEAIAAALAWHDRRTGGGRTVCMIGPDNAASLRLAERAGYRNFARRSFNGAPTLLFERP